MPIVTRIVRAGCRTRAIAEDLVQETLVKVLAKAHRIAPGMLEPYAIVTARNVVRSFWTERDRAPTQPASGARAGIGRVAGRAGA